MENVFAVKSKENEHGEWILAAVDRNGPRLIFPCRRVKWTEEYEDIDKSVFFVVEHERQDREITVEFHSSCAAKTFYQYVISRPTPYVIF